MLEGFSYILTWILLLWGHGLAQMQVKMLPLSDFTLFPQVMQLAYGIATSTEVAYFTYIYAKISGQYYRLVPNLTDDSYCMRKMQQIRFFSFEK